MNKENKCPRCGYDLNLEKKKNGKWSTQELVQATKNLYPELWENDSTSNNQSKNEYTPALDGV